MGFKQFNKHAVFVLTGIMLLLLHAAVPLAINAGDLEQIKQQGVLRHLGVTYANFVRKVPKGVDEYDGLDVELMQLFAKHLKVKYQFVSTTWADLFADLTGYEMDSTTKKPGLDKTRAIKGDVIANGLTILPWRMEIVNYSTPTFPTGVWVISKAHSPLKPITPSGSTLQDIKNVKLLLKGHSVLTMEGTCLAPELYDLEGTQTEIRLFTKSRLIDDVAPAMLDGMAESTLLDIPSAMTALQKWPGEIKIIGPISHEQLMGVGFPKSAPELLKEFNNFFRQIWKDGTYRLLVEKYYPSVFLYLGDFFDKQ